MERIGFGKRVLAYCIDDGAVAIVLCVAIFIGSHFFGILLAVVGSLLLYLPLCFVMLFILEVTKGASPGKMVLGIQIKSDDGSAAPMSRLLKRAALKHSFALLGLLSWLTGFSVVNTIASLLGFIVFLGCFMVLTADKQSLHDRFAGTAVYSVR